MKENNYRVVLERYLRHRTEEDEKVLVDWVRNSPELLAHMEKQILSMPAEIDNEVALKNLKAIYASIDKKPIESKRILSLSILAKVAAVLLLPIISGYLVYNIMQKSLDEYLSLPLTAAVLKGQKAQLMLPDSSFVWLNANSSLTYSANYNQIERRVELTGEAYFKVEANSSSPFIVVVNDMQVEALGTAFVVKAYPDDEIIYTVLQQGKVQVSALEFTSLLDPNEQVVYNRRTQLYEKKSVVNADDYIGWITDRLHFENSTFEQIMKDVSRIYDVQIEIRNTRLMSRRFTGTIPNNSAKGILNCMQQSVSFSYKKNNNQIVIE